MVQRKKVLAAKKWYVKDNPEANGYTVDDLKSMGVSNLAKKMGSYTADIPGSKASKAKLRRLLLSMVRQLEIETRYNPDEDTSCDSKPSGYASGLDSSMPTPEEIDAKMNAFAAAKNYAAAAEMQRLRQRLTSGGGRGVTSADVAGRSSDGKSGRDVRMGDVPCLFGTLASQRYNWDDVIRIIAEVEGIADYKACSSTGIRSSCPGIAQFDLSSLSRPSPYRTSVLVRMSASSNGRPQVAWCIFTISSGRAERLVLTFALSN